MNVKYENAPGLLQELVVEIAKDDYAADYEAALKSRRRSTVLPGFRPGNAPMGLIKRQYGPMLLMQEVDRLVNERLNSYFEEEKIEYVFNPMLVPEKSSADFEKETDFVFAYQFVLAPQLTIDYASMPVFKEFRLVPDEKQIMALMEPKRRKYGRYFTPEEVGEEDGLTIGYGDGKSGFVFVNDFRPEVRKDLIGKKLGETANVALRDAFIEEETLQRILGLKKEDIDKDNEYRYNITIKYIGRMQLAELDEDFFKKAFADGSVTNEAEYRQWAVDRATQEARHGINRRLMSDISDTFVDKVTVEVPEDFIKRFIVAANPKLEEDYDNETDIYLKTFRWQVIEDYLVREGNIHVKTDDVRSYFRDYFQSQYVSQFADGITGERMEALLDKAMENKEDVRNAMHILLEWKILDYLHTKLNIEYVEGDGSAMVEFLFPGNGNTEAKTAEKPEVPAGEEDVKSDGQAG